MRVRGEAHSVEPDAWVQELTWQFAQLVQQRAVSWESNEPAAPPADEAGADIAVEESPPAAAVRIVVPPSNP